MNKQIFEANLTKLEKKYPAWANIIEKTTRKKRRFDVISEQSVSGDTILKVNQNGRVLYLNGKYAPAAPAERWLKQQGKIAEYAPIVIVGISNAMHIRRIQEEAPATANFLIYEPSFELFRRILQEVDLTFLFEENIPVGIIVDGLNENEIDVYFRHFVTIDNMASLKYYISGNYEKLFSESVEDFIKRLRKHIFDIEVGWNTNVRYTEVNAKNTFSNLPYLYEGYSAEDLKGILPADVPVIVVSAGPSLNKNIMELKKAQGKACIIATDTAMKPLLNAGITPNMFVIVDGLKPSALFEHKDISKVPMVTMTGVSVEPMKIHKGKKFFYYSGSAFENKILSDLGAKEKRNRILLNIPTGGSVATTAYSLGIYMGAQTVILVGQDLAMTDNRTHADGTFKDKMDEIDVTSGEYFEVDGIDGEKVLTRSDFKLYLDWFEKYIKEWSHITTIDATEGGALIHGSKTMTLKNAIKKYCKREYNVKWHMDRIPKIFVGDNRKIALDYFMDSAKKIEEVRKKATAGLANYEKLEKLIKKGNCSDKEMQKTIKRIKKVNNYMENDYMAETVIDSLKALEYALRPLIYQMQETQNDELLDIAKQGRVMLYSIAVATREIEQFAKDTVVTYAQRHAEKEKKTEKSNNRVD